MSTYLPHGEPSRFVSCIRFMEQMEAKHPQLFEAAKKAVPLVKYAEGKKYAERKISILTPEQQAARNEKIKEGYHKLKVLDAVAAYADTSANTVRRVLIECGLHTPRTGTKRAYVRSDAEFDPKIKKQRKTNLAK